MLEALALIPSTSKTKQHKYYTGAFMLRKFKTELNRILLHFAPFSSCQAVNYIENCQGTFNG
jgi:hypothetical protein